MSIDKRYKLLRIVCSTEDFEGYAHKFGIKPKLYGRWQAPIKWLVFRWFRLHLQIDWGV